MYKWCHESRSCISRWLQKKGTIPKIFQCWWMSIGSTQIQLHDILDYICWKSMQEALCGWWCHYWLLADVNGTFGIHSHLRAKLYKLSIKSIISIIIYTALITKLDVGIMNLIIKHEFDLINFVDDSCISYDIIAHVVELKLNFFSDCIAWNFMHTGSSGFMFTIIIAR